MTHQQCSLVPHKLYFPQGFLILYDVVSALALVRISLLFSLPLLLFSIHWNT
jgi:hypothetical protein